jgi:hypothetical protein
VKRAYPAKRKPVALAIRVDLKGQRFDRLVVDRIAEGEAPGRKTLWWCLCDCGVYVRVNGQALVTANTRSCGCLRRQRSTERVADEPRDDAGRWENNEIPLSPASAADVMSIFPPAKAVENVIAPAMDDVAPPAAPTTQPEWPETGSRPSAIEDPNDLSAFELAPSYLGVFDAPMTGAAAAILALEAHQCRWPIGEPSDPSFRFCAAPCDPRATPRYCAAHRQRRDRSPADSRVAAIAFQR